MDPSRRVYDDKDNKAGSDYGDSGGLDKVKNQEKDGSLYNPGGAAKKTADAAKSATDGAKAVASAVAGPGGLAGAATSLAKNSINWLKSNKKKSAAGAGIIATIFTMLFGMFMLIIPLKIEHVVKNLEKRFFATSEDAMGNMSDRMMKSYIKNKVLPGYNKCGSTISRKCVAVVNKSSTNPVTRMYTAWSNNKLENKLADKGIEFKREGNTWKIKHVEWHNNGVDIGPRGQQIEREFKSKREFKLASRQVIRDNTKWYQVMYRFRIGRLLETKYGIIRHIIFDGAHDTFDEFKVERKLAAKLTLIERVITPRNANLSIVMACLLSGTCDEKLKDQPSDPATDPATEGEPKSQLEGETRAKMQSGAGEFGDVKKQLKIKKGIEEDGFKKWLAKKVLGDLLGETAAKISSKAIPIIGWIDMFSTVVHTAKEAGPTVRKLIYLSNAPAAVSLYMQYRTYADEIHTGHKDAAEVGSFVSSLGPNSKNTNFDKKTSKLSVGEAHDQDTVVGGVAGAEQAPLYGAIMGGKNAITTKNAYLNPLSPAAYAASNSTGQANNPSYVCNNGKPVPKGQLICSEEKLGQGVGPLDSLNGFLNEPWAQVIVGPSEIWYNSAGWILRQGYALIGEGAGLAVKALDVTCGTPVEYALPISGAYCNLKDPISNAIKDLSDTITNELIPNPFAANMSGGRTFNMMAAGANVAGNDACTQMGCGKVDKKFVADVINNQQKDELDQFKQQPFYARIFNTESNYSLVSRVAMAVPFEYQSSAQSSFASLMSNPLGGLFSAFGNIFGYKYTSAAASENTVDVFNIGTVGYPENAMPDDPEAYWDQHNCTEEIKKWQDASAETSNPTTGMPVHNAPSACLLIKNAVSNMGGALDSSLLSDDDKKHLNGSNSQTSVDGALPSGDSKQLATQLKTYIQSGKISCNNQAANCPDIQKTASGQSIKGGSCNVDALSPKLLSMMLKLSQMNHTYVISAICSDHASNPQSYHHKGKAIDFNYIDGVFIGPGASDNWSGDKLSKAKKFDNDIATFMPKSTGFGQKQCHPDFSFLSGFSVFDDACHHQHIQVED